MESEQRQKRRSLQMVLIAGIVVMGVKFAAWMYTGSNAILSDFLESLINTAAGSFALFSLYFASRPRDPLHPYGRGKMEFLAATAEGTLIFGAGAVIIVKAIYNIILPHTIESIDMGILAISFSVVSNIALGTFLLDKSRQFDSIVLRTDSRRVLSDAYSSLALVIGLIIIYFTHIQWIDSVLAILSGIIIIRTGTKLVKQSVRGLLDAADTETLEEVVQILGDNSRPAWIDIRNLRASHYGMYLYIDCQLTMPWYWNLQQVSEQLQEAEVLINQHFKERVELFVQAEPCLPRHCPQCRIEDCPVRQFPYRRKTNVKLTDLLEDASAAVATVNPGKFSRLFGKKRA